MKKILLMAAISLFAATNASAQTGYFKGALGYSFGGEVEAENDPVDLDGGVFLMGAFGMHISPMFAVEAEVSYRPNDLDVPSDGFGFKIESSMLNLAVNGVFNIPVEGLPIKPYFGGGLTLGNYNLEFSATGVPSEDESGFGLGLQFFGGASFMIQENFSIGADLRYLTTVIEPELGDTDFSFSHLGLLVHGQFSF